MTGYKFQQRTQLLPSATYAAKAFELPRLGLEIVTLGLLTVSEDVIPLAIFSVALRSFVATVWI